MNKRALYEAIQHIPAESPEDAIAIVQRETHADPFTMLIRDFGMTYAELAQQTTTGACGMLARRLYAEFDPRRIADENLENAEMLTSIPRERLGLISSQMLISFITDVDEFSTTSIHDKDAPIDNFVLRMSMRAAAKLYGDLAVLFDVSLDETDFYTHYSADQIREWCWALDLPVSDAESVFDTLFTWLRNNRDNAL